MSKIYSCFVGGYVELPRYTVVSVFVVLNFQGIVVLLVVIWNFRGI